MIFISFDDAEWILPYSSFSFLFVLAQKMHNKHSRELEIIRIKHFNKIEQQQKYKDN